MDQCRFKTNQNVNGLLNGENTNAVSFLDILTNVIRERAWRDERPWRWALTAPCFRLGPERATGYSEDTEL